MRALFIPVIFFLSGLLLPLKGQTSAPVSPATSTEGQTPWGDLETYRIYLQVPDHLLRLMTIPSRQTVWHFPGQTLEQVRQTLLDTGMPAQMVAEVLGPKRWIRDVDSVRVFPSGDIIRNMTPETRSSLYAILSRSRLNRFHFEPFVIELDHLKTMIVSDEHLEEKIYTLIEELSYRRARSTHFSDLPFLLEYLPGIKEQRALIRALTTTPSLVLQLRLPEGQQPDQVIRYWTANGLNRDAFPLLESLNRENAIEVLDVANLLPPTPRRFLNSFPSTEEGLEGRYPDCLWTALNFFNFVPVNLYFDQPESHDYLSRQFRVSQSPLQFGDLLLQVRQSDSKVIHSCVYIADNIVFTKNGSALFQPWVFMRLEEMVAYHQPGQAMSFVSRRRINIPPPSQEPEPQSSPNAPLLQVP